MSLFNSKLRNKSAWKKILSFHSHTESTGWAATEKQWTYFRQSTRNQRIERLIRISHGLSLLFFFSIDFQFIQLFDRRKNDVRGSHIDPVRIEHLFSSPFLVMKDTNVELSVPCENLTPNPSVKLIFDVLTPRPHFIIVQHGEKRKLTATDQEIQHTIQLVTAFLAHQTQYDKSAILSFHRGQWYQRHQKHFHAHLCVPKKPYCQAAKQMVRNDTPLSRIVTLACLVRSQQKQRMVAGPLRRLTWVSWRTITNRWETNMIDTSTNAFPRLLDMWMTLSHRPFP